MVKSRKGPKKEIRNIEEAINHYPEYFDRPSEVLQSEPLSRLDKIKLLKQWKYDIQLEEVAEEENMHSSSPDILDEIQRALSTLKAYEDPEDTPPTKAGD